MTLRDEGFMRWIGAVVLMMCLASSGASSFAQDSAIDEHSLIELTGNVHPLARPQFDRGAVADNLSLEHMLLQLKRSPEQELALEKRIAALYDSRSPDYHKWLTAQEFGDSYGPSQRNLGAVTGWLRSHGFTVNAVYPSGMVIDVSGTAGQ